VEWVVVINMNKNFVTIQRILTPYKGTIVRIYSDGVTGMSMNNTGYLKIASNGPFTGINIRIHNTSDEDSHYIGERNDKLYVQYECNQTGHVSNMELDSMRIYKMPREDDATGQILKYKDTKIYSFEKLIKPDSNSTNCFIATATYESSHAPEVHFLRKWRDSILLNSTSGSLFVNFYYKVSPYIANIINKSLFLKRTSRLLLNILIRIIKK
tara:strand:+ start:356 stop:991 length:636 start_codon:yes stop_codon:yes gene_type:complete